MVELSLSFEHKEGTFSLEDSAANQILKLMKTEGIEDQALLLSVKPGGCAGFIYEFGWADINSPGKKISNQDATLIIKEADLRLIDGGSLKYIENLSGSKFEVVNPNASSSCGCGKSFA